MDKYKQILAVLALLVALAAWRFWPRPISEEQRIRASIEEARQALERRSVRDLMRFLADDYTDNEGNTKAMIRQVATPFLLQAQRVSAGALMRKIEVHGDTAQVDVHVTLVTRSDVGRSDHDLLLELTKASGRWQVKSASGVSVRAEP